MKIESIVCIKKPYIPLLYEIQEIRWKLKAACQNCVYQSWTWTIWISEISDCISSNRYIYYKPAFFKMLGFQCSPHFWTNEFSAFGAFSPRKCSTLGYPMTFNCVFEIDSHQWCLKNVHSRITIMLLVMEAFSFQSKSMAEPMDSRTTPLMMS